MLEVKEAVAQALGFAVDVVNVTPASTSIEEIEREAYKGREVWKITLGFPHAGMAQLMGKGKDYKSFFVDAKSGEVLAMKMRAV